MVYDVADCLLMPCSFTNSCTCFEHMWSKWARPIAWVQCVKWQVVKKNISSLRMYSILFMNILLYYHRVSLCVHAMCSLTVRRKKAYTLVYKVYAYLVKLTNNVILIIILMQWNHGSGWSKYLSISTNHALITAVVCAWRSGRK